MSHTERTQPQIVPELPGTAAREENPMSTRTTMPLNGVDVPTLFATLDVVKATPPAP